MITLILVLSHGFAFGAGAAYARARVRAYQMHQWYGLPKRIPWYFR